MLVLHLLTDVGNFIVPYTFVIHDHLYFSQLGPGHTPLPLLFFQAMGSLSFINRVGLEILYLFNVAGAVMLLVFPAYFWYDYYIGKRIGFKSWMLALFGSSIVTMFLKPAFKFVDISVSSVAGVDIITRAIEPVHIWKTIAVAVLFGFFIYLVSSIIKRKIEIAGMAVSLAFFGYYLYIFFFNLVSYYVSSTIYLFHSHHSFISLFLIFFLIINVFFYIGGFIVFVLETVKLYFSF